jgi:hypothetical protein
MKRIGPYALACVVGCTLVAAGIGLYTWPRLFDGTPRGTGRVIGSECAGENGARCEVKLLELSPGRYWVEARGVAVRELSLEFEIRPDEEPARMVLLAARTDHLTVEVARADPTGGWKTLAAERVAGGFRRGLVRFASPASGRLHVRLGQTEGEERLRLEEIGLFPSEESLLRDQRFFLRSFPDRRVYRGVLGRLCICLAALGLAGVFLLPPAVGRRLAPTFAFFLTFAAATLAVWLSYSPYWGQSRDLRVVLASGPLQEGIGANLNYGMYLGSRLLSGEGLTFGPGWVPWERTPGYAFFDALAGLAAGYKTDLLTIGLYSIKLHLLLLAAACAVFTWAATYLMRPAVALAAAVVIAFMPNQLANTQADSIMVSVYLLTAAALCLYLERAGSSPPPLRYHLLVHASFALWFLMRPDGAVGWAAVSVLLYWRARRYLAIPAAAFLAIGLSWGAYKYRYTGEFSMTTNTVGDNAWIGLWQVPNKFRWQTADPSYFAWAKAKGIPATSKRASDVALREVGRFALTYPVYVSHLVLHRFIEYGDVDCLLGLISFPHLDYRLLDGGPVWSLMGVVVLCLATGHQRRRTLYLGWPLFFNLPVFLLFFSDGGRHIAPVSAALAASSLPPLLEAGFYRALWTRRRLTLLVSVGLVGLLLAGHWLDRTLLASEPWRYWTPFLDPAPFAWYLR